MSPFPEHVTARLKYIAACIDAHADKFPTPKHMRGYAEFLRELADDPDGFTIEGSGKPSELEQSNG